MPVPVMTTALAAMAASSTFAYGVASAFVIHVTSTLATAARSTRNTVARTATAAPTNTATCTGRHVGICSFLEPTEYQHVLHVGQYDISRYILLYFAGKSRVAMTQRGSF